MANKVASALVLRDGDRARLESMLRSSTLAAGLAQRARVVLLAGDGVANYEIADRVGVSRPTVNLWRSRYTDRGLAGLSDEKRPGRPRTVDRSRVITATLTPPAPIFGGDPLVVAATRGAVGAGALNGRSDLEGIRGQAVAGGDVQVLHRP